MEFQDIEFKLRGKVVRMARLLKDVSIQEFSKLTGIHHNTIAMIEREERSISRLNEIRMVRELKKLGITDAQLASLQLIVEHDEGEFDKWQRKDN